MKRIRIDIRLPNFDEIDAAISKAFVDQAVAVVDDGESEDSVALDGIIALTARRTECVMRQGLDVHLYGRAA